jgi:hypothetical protein
MKTPPVQANDKDFIVESSDVKAAPVYWIGGAFAAFLVLLALLLSWVFGSAIEQWVKSEPLVGHESFPKPTLHPRPKADLARQRQIEAQELQVAEWIGKDHHFARVPIDRALEIAAKNHLILIPKATDTEEQNVH